MSIAHEVQSQSERLEETELRPRRKPSIRVRPKLELKLELPEIIYHKLFVINCANTAPLNWIAPFAASTVPSCRDQLALSPFCFGTLEFKISKEPHLKLKIEETFRLKESCWRTIAANAPPAVSSNPLPGRLQVAGCNLSSFLNNVERCLTMFSKSSLSKLD